MRTRIAVIVLAISALVLPACAADDPSEVESTEETTSPTEDAAPAAGEPTAAAAGQESAPAGDAADGALTLTAGDIYYAVDGQQSTDADLALSAPAGEVAITLANEGNLPHNIVVEEDDDTMVVEAEAGASESGTIELDAGTYTLYCNIVGHREAGMEASLTVQ